jgi:hypothetical protein
VTEMRVTDNGKMGLGKFGFGFDLAIRYLKEGRKVKRHNWGGYWFIPKFYVRVYSEVTDRYSYANKMIMAKLKNNGGLAPATPYMADMLAEDWELVQPENKYYEFKTPDNDYSALIVAQSLEQATQIYFTDVCSDGLPNGKEVPQETAWGQLKNAIGSDEDTFAELSRMFHTVGVLLIDPELG